MKLPLTIGIALTSAITATVALTGELHLSHPLHQAAVIAGGLAIAIVAHLAGISAGQNSLTTPAAPPYNIPEPLPTSASTAVRAAVDAAATRTLP